MTDDNKQLIRVGETISPRKIYEEVSKTVVGQEQAKKLICNTVFMHFVRYLQLVSEGQTSKKSNALLMGPTGCGKTYIVREASRAIQKLTGFPICPVLEVDCTELTGRGWEGDNLSDHIKDHYKEFGGNEASFNTSIVFLDEFDKLCKPAVGSGGHDHNRLTQYNLLKLIEGTEVKMDSKSPFASGGSFNTHSILFIMAGNFSEIRRSREDSKKPSMGFSSENSEEKSEFIDYHTELEANGMATQLVGRTPYIAELNALTSEELRIILDRYLIPELSQTWRYLRSDLVISEENKVEIVENCFKRKTGARGLQADLCKHVEDELFDLEFTL